MFNKILVPTDGSPLSGKAIAAAIRFAKESNSEIVVLSVVPSYAYGSAGYGLTVDLREMERLEQLARLLVNTVAAVARTENVRCSAITSRAMSPSEEIVNAVRRFNCDAVFMATHRRSRLGQLFNDSETEKVVAASAVPIVVFH